MINGLITMLMIAVFAIGFLLWTYTKSGKKWLHELQ